DGALFARPARQISRLVPLERLETKGLHSLGIGLGKSSAAGNKVSAVITVVTPRQRPPFGLGDGASMSDRLAVLGGRIRFGPVPMFANGSRPAAFGEHWKRQEG